MNISYQWLSNPLYYRYGFFIILLGSILLNNFFLQHENFFILYVLSTIFLGIGFYKKPTWFLIFFTLIIVICRFYPLLDSSYSLVTFFIFLLTYLLITFITVGLVTNIQKVKQDNLELVTALSNALDSRDSYTMNHSENVAKYAVETANKMRLPKAICNNIQIGALLHDIGKIGISERILTKPDQLTNEEYNYIKSHPTIGFEMLKHVSSFKDNGILDIILFHHERYDGKGYPLQIKGDQIPLAARIVAVADTFDAMTSKRVYRNDLDLQDALNEIRNNKGTQFDPEIVDVFLSLFEKENNTKNFSGDLNLQRVFHPLQTDNSSVG